MGKHFGWLEAEICVFVMVLEAFLDGLRVKSLILLWFGTDSARIEAEVFDFLLALEGFWTG